MVKYRILKIFAFLSFLFSFNLQKVFATDGTIPPGSEGDIPSANDSGGMSIKLKNPLGTTDTIPVLIQKLLDIVLTIGVPLIALAIIYAGYQLVTAQGNPGKLEIARRNLVYVVIGAGILLAAYAIAQVIAGTITSVRG